MRRFTRAVLIVCIACVLASCGGVANSAATPAPNASSGTPAPAPAPPSSGPTSSPAPAPPSSGPTPSPTPAPPSSGPSPAPSPTPTPAPSAPVEVLYIVHGDSTVSAYDVNPETGAASPAGNDVPIAETSNAALASPPNNPLVVPSADDHFAYVEWWAANPKRVRLSVFATDASGSLQAPALQTIDLPSWSEFLVHPSGRFAYALEPDQQALQQEMYASNLVLFPIGSDGRLGTPATLQHFSDAYWWMDLDRISADGGFLYLTSSVSFDGEGGSKYNRYPIDSATGKLGPATNWWGTSYNWTDYDQGIIGDKVMVERFDGSGTGEPSYINVFPNVPPPQKALIHCTSDMLDVCGTASDVHLDPREQYIFASDPVAGTNETQGKIRVLRIDLAGQKLDDTGVGLSYNGGAVVPLFSPDGKLVYLILSLSTANNAKTLTIERFDAGSGTVTPGDTLNLQLADVPYAALRK